MYAFIRGTLRENQPSYAVVEAAGVGYKIAIPLNTSTKLPSCGDTVLLHTTFVVREAFQGLYGFLKAEERDFFEILIEISGIGPKTALNLIGFLPPESLHAVILASDTTSLSKVPGIGKKTAERVLVELKNRLDALPLPKETLPAKNQKMEDALKALMKLGYNPATSQKALKKALEGSKEDSSVSEILTSALKHV